MLNLPLELQSVLKLNLLSHMYKQQVFMERQMPLYMPNRHICWFTDLKMQKLQSKLFGLCGLLSMHSMPQLNSIIQWKMLTILSSRNL